MNPVKAIALQFVNAGFTLVRQKRHDIWACPCGHTQLSSSSTHNEGRGDINCTARIRRTLKVCEQRLKECA